jgi:transcriptional regulator with XRE-family HTH domain
MDILAGMTGKELRRLRTQAGLTQRTLAQALGMTTNYIARLERGEVAVREVVRLAVLRVVESLPGHHSTRRSHR